MMRRDDTGARTMWLGLQFASEADRQNVRNVILATTMMGALQFLCFLINLKTAHGLAGMGSATFNLFVGLLVPFCGYFGAKRSDRYLMGCFCGCAWFQVVVS